MKKAIVAICLSVLGNVVHSQNVGINTTTPSAYGHGGVNRLLEVFNPSALPNSQSHLLLTDSSLSGALGSVTWASKAITASDKRTAIISSSFNASSTAASPKTLLSFYTSNGGSLGERLTISPDGNIGINNNNPKTALSFPAVLGKKITLYPGATGDVGFGVAGNRLQIYSDNSNADVAIGYDNNGTFNERFAVKPTGALAVYGNTGSYGQLLMSGGAGSPNWMSPSQIIMPFFMDQTAPFVVTSATENQITGAVLNVTVPVAGKLVIWPSVHTNFSCANPLDACTFVLQVKTLVDNVDVNRNWIQGQSQVGQQSDDKQIGPIVVDLTAGNHAINFHEVFTTIGAMIMNISAFAQFYPN